MKIENAIFTNSFKNYIKTKIKTHKIFSEIIFTKLLEW